MLQIESRIRKHIKKEIDINEIASIMTKPGLHLEYRVLSSYPLFTFLPFAVFQSFLKSVRYQSQRLHEVLEQGEWEQASLFPAILSDRLKELPRRLERFRFL